MSTPNLHPATRSRWMDWKPKARILPDLAESEPTKPSKPGFVGFEGATSAESPEIETGPDPAELARACGVLNRAGVRIMALEGGATIGVWSDLDGPEVGAALRTFGSDRLPVRYLDGAGVPMRYKARRVDGEPVPMNVLAAMEQHPADPWKVRDRMLDRDGVVLEGYRLGGVEGGGAEPAFPRARRHQETGPNHGGECPPRRKETMKKPEDNGKGGAVIKVRSPEERAELMKKFRKITGTTTESGAERVISQMLSMQAWFKDETEEKRVTAAADLIAEFQPSNPTEALLAVQMFGVHEAATLLLKRATVEGQTFEGTDANVLRATRLMRLFNEQVELMAKLKGRPSQQKVTVEHVHVHQGGQAIVGAVSTTRNDQGGGG